MPADQARVLRTLTGFEPEPEWHADQRLAADADLPRLLLAERTVNDACQLAGTYAVRLAPAVRSQLIHDVAVVLAKAERAARQTRAPRPVNGRHASRTETPAHISVAEASHWLGLSGRRIRHLLETHQLSGYQPTPGGKWFIAVASLETYLADRSNR